MYKLTYNNFYKFNVFSDIRTDSYTEEWWNRFIIIGIFSKGHHFFVGEQPIFSYSDEEELTDKRKDV